MFNLLSPYAIDSFLPIAKWLAIGFVGAFIIAILIVGLTKKDLLKKTVKVLLSCLFVFLLALGLACLIMEIVKSYSSTYAEENWLDRNALIKFVLIPISVLVLSLLASSIVIFFVIKKNNEENQLLKKTLRVLGIINLVFLIAVGVLLAIYYNQKFVDDGYYNSDTASVNQVVLYISAVLLILAIFAVALIFNKDKKSIDTRCIAMAGITLAMSFGLSYIKLFELPQGGSVTLFSLLPIMIFSCLYGTKKGVFVCLIYGILQAIQDPWIIHPAQFFLDYPIAFDCIGLSGIFFNAKKLERLPQVAFISGGVLAGVLRFVCHVLSGVFAFSAYADGVNPWAYSLAYNSFVFVDIALTLVIGVIVFSSKAFVKELQKRTEA